MDAVIDVYLNQEAFHALPNAPTFLMSGDIIHLISYEEHLITAMPGLEAVRSLSSFTDLVMNVKIGDMTPKTTDSKLAFGREWRCSGFFPHLSAECVRVVERFRVQGLGFRDGSLQPRIGIHSLASQRCAMQTQQYLLLTSRVFEAWNCLEASLAKPCAHLQIRCRMLRNSCVLFC